MAQQQNKHRQAKGKPAVAPKIGNEKMTTKRGEEEKPKTLKDLLLKAALGLIIVIAFVRFTDFKGYFNPDYSNDHTRRKWNSFYKFTKNNPVDVVLVGNSHLYTGINSENLSTALGANCFILASPGTSMTDVYYCLKEAIQVNKPKIAVVETFGINDYHSHELDKGPLYDQFKSFSARKNIGQKLCSTPVLFNSRYYLSAWSNTVRNHNFLFSDPEQMKKNIELNKTGEPEMQGLYLGRYIRFTSGLEDSTLVKYDKVTGLDGNKFKVSDEAKEFVAKTVKLCKENNVKLVFLTLPMYYRHFKNPEKYVAKVAEAVSPYHELWENQQIPYDYQAFTPECFENTTNENQHMTYYGSLVSTYKLADFIRKNLKGTLYNRSNDMAWKQLFYGSDGYFQNYSPENDGVSQILLKDQTINGLQLKEVDFVPNQGGKQLLVKVDKSAASDLAYKKLIVQFEIEHNGQTQTVPLEVTSSGAYIFPGYYLFSSAVLNSEIKAVAIKNIEITGDN